MGYNRAMTNSTPAEASPTCPYCGDEYAAERAEIGYAFCMKKECSAQGKKDKGTKPIEIAVVQPETRF